MVDLIVKVVADPLTILALIKFIKKYKIVAASYVVTLTSGYKHKWALYIKQIKSLYIKL